MAKKSAIKSKSKSTKEKIITIEPISTVKPAKNISEKVAAPFKFVNQKIRKMPLISEAAAEFIGTFLLVVMVFSVQNQPLYIAFAMIGIVLMFGKISGAYVNPAMVAGSWITRKIKSLRAMSYILAEIFGAVVAWFTVNAFATSAYKSYSITVSDYLLHAGTIASGSEWLVFFAELLGALILALGVSVAIRSKKSSIKSACAYGFAALLALIFSGWATSALLSGSYTTLSILNPALAIATSALSWNIWPIAIFVIAPVIGGILGFGIMELIKINDNEECECICEK